MENIIANAIVLSRGMITHLVEKVNLDHLMKMYLTNLVFPLVTLPERNNYLFPLKPTQSNNPS